MNIAERIFQNIIKIAKYWTFIQLAVLHPLSPFTYKPLSLFELGCVYTLIKPGGGKIAQHL